MLDQSKEEVAQLHARGNESWRHPEPTQSTRDEVYHSPELEWIHMEENQPESAATGSEGMGTDDTTLIEGVGPSSLAAAGDRLAVHLNSFQYCMSW